MQTMTLPGVIDENHTLSVKLPPNFETLKGHVDLIIHLENDQKLVIEVKHNTPINPEREIARAKLQAAGLLSSAYTLPSDVVIPTDAEVYAAGSLPPNAISTDELVNEDRGEV